MIEERGTNEVVDDALAEWLEFSEDPRINSHGIYKALGDLLRLYVEDVWGYSSLEAYATLNDEKSF